MSLILDGTNGLSDVDGSAATPAIRGSDANTGVFFGADQVGIATNGVERVEFGNSETVFNDGGANVDFRVEGDTDANLLFVDASADKVGIGTSSPTGDGTALHINGSSFAYLHLTNNTTGATASDGFDIVTDGSDILLRNRESAAMRFATAGAERMRIDSSGNLLIGYTSSNGSFKLQVNSQIFATNATISTSDGRYKEDIQSLDGALDLVAQLNPVQFSWKEHPVHNFDRSGPTVGFIAQEVQQVLANKPYLNSIIKANKCVVEPEEKDLEGNVTKEAVTEEFLGIAEGNMIAILTKAIQELKADFDAYKASHP
jgi:hypothetical protein